eukprot:TRINITY_DN894_c0_g1_i2.p1 TRINITY_DN894_c0_g1~~TRINITY_DN894_c0_g1_i2.p1  ORF type:complete len:162 (+),score=36.14 TRINITY_DN894_c0_g1_i2:11-496(+)
MKSLYQSLLGQEKESSNSILTEISEATTLSWKTRVICFACFALAGLSLSIISSFFVTIIVVNPVPFAVLYTLSNIAYLTSTCFLMGPLKQLKKMFELNRLVSTIIYIAAMVLTLLSALVWKKPFLVIIFVIIQSCALFWYSLSFIPFGQTIVKNAATKIIV